MYTLHDDGTESEFVVQRSIWRSMNIQVSCPTCKAYPLVLEDERKRIWHDFWHQHALMKKRAALCCVLCDGRAIAVRLGGRHGSRHHVPWDPDFAWRESLERRRQADGDQDLLKYRMNLETRS